MPDQDKKLKSTEKEIEKKPPGISMSDYCDLKRFQSLLSVQSRNQQSCFASVFYHVSFVFHRSFQLYTLNVVKPV